MRIGYSGGEAPFDLGPDAEKWADKIRSPKSLLDKLGMNPGMKVSLVGLDDTDFKKQLRVRTENAPRDLARADRYDASYTRAHADLAIFAHISARSGATFRRQFPLSLIPTKGGACRRSTSS